MIYPIYVYGSSVLKKKSSIIYKNDIDVKKLANDMFETMEYADGIGLAAPQIGKSIRIFVIDGSSLNDSNMLNFKKIFVNPTIINQYGDEWEFEEGCLSIPLIKEKIRRKSIIEIEFSLA